MIKLLFLVPAALAFVGCTGEQDGQSSVPAGANAAAEDAAMTNPDPMKDAPTAGSTGPEYASAASASDSFEIQSSEIALQKAQGSAVKQFAQMIINDHRKSAADLKNAARQAQIAVASPPQLDMEQQANLIELRQASGAEFDTIYLQQQMAAHQNALTLVQAYAQDGTVPSLKQHAANVIGSIKRHLDQIRQMQGQRPSPRS